jgi:hypothetical protein
VIPASRQRNYLQSALYVIIAGVLAAVLLARLLAYAELAEKAAMDATLSQLHSGLYARVAFLALRGEYEALEALPAQSPFLSARMKSPNYLGEFDGIPVEAEGGRWLYDRQRHELVYVPNLRRYLAEGPAGRKPNGLRFKLEVLKASKHAYTGVSLRPVEPFEWSPPP